MTRDEALFLERQLIGATKAPKVPRIETMSCQECKWEKQCTVTNIRECRYEPKGRRTMIVEYDEEFFSIKLRKNIGEKPYEVIPIEELLEVWEDHKRAEHIRTKGGGEE